MHGGAYFPNPCSLKHESCRNASFEKTGFTSGYPELCGE